MSRISLAIFAALSLSVTAGPLVNPFVSFPPSGGGGFDTDAAAYFTRASITDAGAKTDINSLVLFLKSEGIFASLTDAWLLRTNQQATGGTKYALKSNANNGTIVGSPSMGADGLTFTWNDQGLHTGSPYTALVQTMNHDWTAVIVFRHTVVNASYGRVLGAVPPNSAASSLLYHVGASGLSSPTMGAYSVSGNTTKINMSDISSYGMLASAYNHSLSQWQPIQNSTVHSVVSGTHGAGSHTFALSNSGVSAEAFYTGTISCVFLWSTTRITNSNIANLYGALKTTVSQGLSLP